MGWLQNHHHHLNLYSLLHLPLTLSSSITKSCVFIASIFISTWFSKLIQLKCFFPLRRKRPSDSNDRRNKSVCISRSKINHPSNTLQLSPLPKLDQPRPKNQPSRPHSHLLHRHTRCKHAYCQSLHLLLGSPRTSSTSRHSTPAKLHYCRHVPLSGSRNQ